MTSLDTAESVGNQQQDQQEKLLTPTQAAELLFISTETLRRHAVNNDIQSEETPGKHRCYTLQAVEEFKNRVQNDSQGIDLDQDQSKNNQRLIIKDELLKASFSAEAKEKKLKKDFDPKHNQSKRNRASQIIKQQLGVEINPDDFFIYTQSESRYSDCLLKLDTGYSFGYLLDIY